MPEHSERVRRNYEQEWWKKWWQRENNQASLLAWVMTIVTIVAIYILLAS